MEHRGNDTDCKKSKFWEKDLFQCHFVHQKSHMDCPTIESGSLRLQDTNSPQLYLFITLFKSYWRNTAAYNIYIMYLQTIIIHIGPLCFDHKVK
jgi:hypothetical protein